MTAGVGDMRAFGLFKDESSAGGGRRDQPAPLEVEASGG
jgi:hypothetical protein